MVIQEDGADDLLESVDRSLKEAAPRRTRRCCRSKPSMPDRVLDILVENFEVDEDVVMPHVGAPRLRRLDGADLARPP